jgi:hypothetical protein
MNLKSKVQIICLNESVSGTNIFHKIYKREKFWLQKELYLLERCGQDVLCFGFLSSFWRLKQVTAFF